MSVDVCACVRSAVAKSRKDLKRDRKIAQQLAGPSLIGTCESTVTVQGRNFDADDIKESEGSGEVECIKIEHFSIAFRGEDLLNNVRRQSQPANETNEQANERTMMEDSSSLLWELRTM